MSIDTKISDVIDRQKLSRFQKRIAALCMLLAFVEGFDAQSPGYVAPTLGAALHLSPNAMGLFFSAGLVGLMLGALLVAPLADRTGRKTVLVACAVLFGLASLAIATSTTLRMLYLLRLLAGLGIGGAMPNVIALISEYAPQRNRSLMVVLTYNGFILGAITAGLVASRIVEALGWQSIFVVGGVFPLLLAPILMGFLPESVRFLALKAGAQARVVRILTRIDPQLQVHPTTRFVLDDDAGGRMSVRALFAQGRGRRTVLLWVMFFMSLLDLYLLTNWLPTQMRALGFALTVAIVIGAMLQVGGVIGLVLGWLMDRIGHSRTLTASYLVAGVSIACIGLVGDRLPLVVASVLGAGFGIIGGQTAANAAAAASYPTAIRSTGVGWALGIGRIGSVVGPMLGGVLISMHVPNRDIFFLAVAPALCAALAAFLLGKHAAPSNFN
jgi:AAHS family 4-hydroxybenzoate transporter-like MFS transporter